MNNRYGIYERAMGDGDRWGKGRRLDDPFFFAGAMGVFMPGAAPGAGLAALSSTKRKHGA